jgi:glutamate-1-semialdehyde 2,1-aminomutase
MERAEGGYLYDVDGNRYIEYDMAHGAGMSGHSHPKLVETMEDRIRNGTLFTHPSPLLAEAAKELKKRWSAIEKVRFTNSGSESTMHAMRIARGYTGREKIIKIEGGYHGAHDYVLYNAGWTPLAKAGHPDRPTRVPFSDGIPSGVAESIEIAPWNDLEALEQIFRENIQEVAGIIIEPVLLNAGVTQPMDEYLQGVRELCDEYHAVMIMDEVKTGVKVAPGGGAEYYGVEPDLVTLAKSIGGMYPVGAFGGKDEVMSVIEEGTVHYGTYNGNPLGLDAIITTLRDILTDDAYDYVNRLGDRMAQGYEDIMADAGITGHVENVNSQGLVIFNDNVMHDYREVMQTVDEELHMNFLFSMLNQGVMPHGMGATNQWTISVQHTEEDIDETLEAFKNVAPRVAEAQDG